MSLTPPPPSQKSCNYYYYYYYDHVMCVCVCVCVRLLGADDDLSPLTALSLLGCTVCLLQLLLLQPSFNKCVAKFLKLSVALQSRRSREIFSMVLFICTLHTTAQHLVRLT